MNEELFSKETFNGMTYTLPYRFHTPENYEDGKCYPLMLFLHGAGERGTDNELQLAIGILTALSDPESPLHDSYIICPQCPCDVTWVATPWDKGSYNYREIPETPYLSAADELVEETIKKFPVNKKKVYVSGISMGGYGSWDTLARHGEKYAGAFICCGSGDPSIAKSIKEKTIYNYHGGLDTTVPTQGSRDMVAALEKAGAGIHYAEYPDLYHNSWDMAYSQFNDMKELFNHEK